MNSEKKVEENDIAEISEDELYEAAKEVVAKAKKASAPLLQRKLKIGYARAARIIDLLEDEGMIGPYNGAEPRDVYENKE